MTNRVFHSKNQVEEEPYKFSIQFKTCNNDDEAFENTQCLTNQGRAAWF